MFEDQVAMSSEEEEDDNEIDDVEIVKHNDNEA